MAVTRYHSDRSVRVRYRLTAEPPFTIVFPSAIFEVTWSQDAQGLTILAARDLNGGSDSRICDYRANLSPVEANAATRAHEDLIRRSPWTTGVSVLRPCVLDTLFQRMVRDGRAELVDGPHSEVRFFVLHGVSP